MIILIRMIRKKLTTPANFTEESSTGNWLKIVMILLLYRVSSSLLLINWSISVPPTAYLTAMYRSAQSIHGIIPSLLLYVRMMKRNSSESTTSVKTTKLHGLMKKTVFTQISSPAVRWKQKAYRFLHSDATGCAEIRNNFFRTTKGPGQSTGALF